MKINAIFCGKISLVMVFVFLTALIFSSSATVTYNANLTDSVNSHLTDLTPSSSIEILNDTAFDLYGLPGNGSAVDPYIISGLNISTTDTFGIRIYQTSKYFVIQNCYIDASDQGILIENVEFSTTKIENNVCVNNANNGISLWNSFGSVLINNTCLYNGNSGIYTDFADFSIISNNTCKGNFEGIYLFDTYDTNVTGNICSENFVGMVLEEAFGSIVENNTCNDQIDGIVVVLSEQVNITKNVCQNNLGYGILLFDMHFSNVTFNNCSNNGECALLLEDCSSLIVSNNTFMFNLVGILPEFTEYSNFTYNLIQENVEFGISLSSNNLNNTFHHNAFISNALGLGTSQVCDNGTDNIWYDTVTLEGNFWDDYVGPGSYVIDGTGGNDDLYPLGEIPVIVEFNGNLFSILFLLLIPIVPICAVIRRRIRN